MKKKFNISKWKIYDQSSYSMVKSHNGFWKSNNHYPIVDCGKYATVCGKIVLVTPEFELKE